MKRWKDDALVAYLARDPHPEAEAKYVWLKGFQKHLELFGASELREDHKLPVRILMSARHAIVIAGSTPS